MGTRGAVENQVTETYRRRAGRYDLSANLYYLLGFRYASYRRRAVRALGLRPGDTVVEIGCGTGKNFSLLQEKIGPSGRIIGVDLTDAMLDVAHQRVEKERWTNVELTRCDASEYEFPDEIDGVLSTFALSLSPRCGDVVRAGSEALLPGRRWVVLDLKMPENALASKIVWPIAKPIVKPFAITEEALERRPWEAIGAAMQEGLDHILREDFYLGIVYVASGEGRPG